MKIELKLLVIGFIAIVLSTFKTCPAFAQEDYTLKEINFSGNSSIPSSSLLSQIVLKSQSKIRGLLFWKDPYQFSENILDRDLNRLLRFYQSEGFLNPTFHPKLDVNHKNKTVKLTITISEHEPVLVREIHFRSAENKGNIDKYIEIVKLFLTLKTGKRFRDQDAKNDQNYLLNFFSKSGYPYIQVKLNPVLIEKENHVDVYFEIQTGPKCIFGSTEIIGNKITAESIIRKKISFHEGEVFNQSLVQKSQQQIYQLGFFQFVTLRVMMDNNQDVLPVQVVVKEAPRLTTKFGIGYGKEDQFRLYVDLTRLGFLGGIRRFNLFAKHSGLEPYHFNIKFTQPEFILRQTTLILNPFLKQEKEPGFTIDRVGTNISLQYQITSLLNSYLNYALEQDNLKVSTITRTEALNNENVKLYNKSSITFGITHDNSSPPFDPTRGMFKSITLTYSGIGFKSDFHFRRMLIELRRYQSLGENWTLAFRTKVGMMEPIQGDLITPIEERFYAGGSNSIRGWGRSQLGPKSIEGKPIGGDSYFEGTGELRFPIFKKLAGVFFIDLGNVWRDKFTYAIQELHYAGGAGLRFKTPIGPIRFDVAKPIFEGRKPVQFHISVGQSF